MQYEQSRNSDMEFLSMLFYSTFVSDNIINVEKTMKRKTNLLLIRPEPVGSSNNLAIYRPKNVGCVTRTQ